MTLLTVRSLVSEFQTPRGPIQAVDDVDLDVAQGEVVCLVGESGCGKSAFANSVMGLMPAGRAAHPAGSITFDGQPLLDLDSEGWQRVRGRQIGMIFQEPMTSLNPVMRIGRQVAEPLLIHGLADKDAAREAAIASLAAVGIPGPAEIMNRYPHELSGGMRQRVMIATATIASPKLLIADEPTTALDVTIEAQILNLLNDMRRETGMAMLFITHDLGVVAQIADRVCVMYAGQIVETGTVSDVFDQPRHPYTEGLLRSMPRRGRRSKRMVTIPGNVPAPHERPSGCRFQPRCGYVTSECQHPVDLREAGGDQRLSRCLHLDQVGQEP